MTAAVLLIHANILAFAAKASTRIRTIRHAPSKPITTIDRVSVPPEEQKEEAGTASCCSMLVLRASTADLVALRL